MDWITDPQIWIAFTTLVVLELVLGVDNVIFISILLLIGFTLIVEGMHQQIPKGYIYFAMAFSVLVEMLNLRLRRKQVAPVKLHEACKS